MLRDKFLLTYAWITENFIYYIDFSIHILRTESGTNVLTFNRRDGLPVYFKEESPDGRLFTSRFKSAVFPIKLHGAYKEKMNKDIQHLSKLCYEKDGVKDDELF